MKFNFKQWCIKNNYLDLLNFYELANNDLKSDEISFSCCKVVNLKCNVCKNVWRKDMNHLTRKPVVSLCPFCNHEKVSSFYNFKVIYPSILEQWNYELNNVNPETIFPTTRTIINWKCERGHEWKESVKNRVKRFKESGNRAICPICSKSKVSSYYNLMLMYPEIARQWDYNRNNGLSPADVAPASCEKVWWVCDFNPNHKWQCRISNRTILNRGCPECSKKWKISYPALALYYYLYLISPDAECEVPFNKKYKIDILLKDKKVAIEHNGFYYHSDKIIKNKDLQKIKELEESGYRILSIFDSKECEDIKVENNNLYYPFDYQNKYLDKMICTVIDMLNLPKVDINSIRDRFKIDCFYNHIRKIQTISYKYPELVKEWSDKNDFGPDMYLPNSLKKVWWKCLKCNQEYECYISNKIKHQSGCPYCGNRKVNEKNNLAVKYPDVAKEWNYERNGDLKPELVGATKELKVWWKCGDGHEWETTIYSRTGPRKTKCPYCAHKKVHDGISLQTINPKLSKLWHPDLNYPLTPNDVTAHSNKKMWWKCDKGHEWQNTPNSLSNIESGIYCPCCRNSKISRIV